MCVSIIEKAAIGCERNAGFVVSCECERELGREREDGMDRFNSLTVMMHDATCCLFCFGVYFLDTIRFHSLGKGAFRQFTPRSGVHGWHKKFERRFLENFRSLIL